MKLNPTAIRTSLLETGEVYVNPMYLSDDMKFIYEYYVITKDYHGSIESIKEYFDNYERFDPIEFSKAYLHTLVDHAVDLEITLDGWGKITLTK